MSADGGWTWGLCAEDAAYADRRVPSTVLDQDGYLLVMGGFDASGVSSNDVWRSAVSFNNLRVIAQVCHIQSSPVCGLGLQCLPGMPGFQRRQLTASPVCDAQRVCSGEYPDEGSSSTAVAHEEEEEEEGSGWGVGIIAAALAAALFLAAAWYYVHTAAQRSRASAGAVRGSGGVLVEQLLGMEGGEGQATGSSAAVTAVDSAGGHATQTVVA